MAQLKCLHYPPDSHNPVKQLCMSLRELFLTLEGQSAAEHDVEHDTRRPDICRIGVGACEDFRCLPAAGASLAFEAHATGKLPRQAKVSQPC